MTRTPNREAARTAAAKARESHAAVLARTDAVGIGQRMALEASEAIVGGLADMIDQAIDPELIWPQIAKALADPLTAFLMSTAWGDKDRAIDLLPGALASIQEMALTRLQIGEAAFAKAWGAIAPPDAPGEPPYPADDFGAHVLTDVLGWIGDREIGPGHVVLSEERYAWLMARAARAGTGSPEPCAWDDATRIAINGGAEARIAALEASLPFAISRHLSTLCSHLLGLYDASEDPKVREFAVAIRASAADAGDAFAAALRPTSLADAILRVTIMVRAGTTATQLTFAPGTKFEAGAAAVDRALASLQAERDESRSCPAWKDDFATGGAP